MCNTKPLWRNGDSKVGARERASFEFEIGTNTFINSFVKLIGKENTKFGGTRVLACKSVIDIKALFGYHQIP